VASFSGHGVVRGWCSAGPGTLPSALLFLLYFIRDTSVANDPRGNRATNGRIGAEVRRKPRFEGQEELKKLSWQHSRWGKTLH
jgi:hypothetical protein